MNSDPRDPKVQKEQDAKYGMTEADWAEEHRMWDQYIEFLGLTPQDLLGIGQTIEQIAGDTPKQ